MQLTKTAKYESLSSGYVERLTSELTPKLRKMAHRSGWPAEVISKLEVRSDGSGGLYVYYPEDIAERVEDLEYGNLNALPNSVIRSFIYRTSSMMDEVLGSEIVDGISDIELTGVMF